MIDRTSLFTDHGISVLPIRAEYKHFRTIWEHTFDNSPTDFKFFFFETMVVNAWSWYFVELLSRFVRQLTISFPHISWHDPPCHRTTKRYADFPSMIIFHLFLWKLWIQTWFCNCQQYLCFFQIVFEYIPGKHDQGKMLVLCKSTRLFSTSPWNRSTSSNVRRAGALVPPPSCLGGGPHGWVPAYTHSTPVLTSVRRLWGGPSNSTSTAQRRRTRNASMRTEPNDVQEPNEAQERAQLSHGSGAEFVPRRMKQSSSSRTRWIMKMRSHRFQSISNCEVCKRSWGWAKWRGRPRLYPEQQHRDSASWRSTWTRWSATARSWQPDAGGTEQSLFQLNVRTVMVVLSDGCVGNALCSFEWSHTVSATAVSCWSRDNCREEWWLHRVKQTAWQVREIWRAWGLYRRSQDCWTLEAQHLHVDWWTIQLEGAEDCKGTSGEIHR